MKKNHIIFTPAALAMIAILLLAFSGIGYRSQWWSLDTGFLLFRWAAFVGVAAIVLGIAVILFNVRPWPNPRIGLGAISIIVGAFAVLTPYQWLKQVQSLPFIHDITTDTLNPPQFVAIAPLRAGAPNPITYDFNTNADAQLSAYPDIETLNIALPTDSVFTAALNAVNALGLEIIEAEPLNGRIEATATSQWFGFKDDLVIRIVASEDGSQLDMRSKSRVGKSDVGVNAERIRQVRSLLMRELQLR